MFTKWATASLCIFSETMEPAQIQSQISVSSSYTHVKGQPVSAMLEVSQDKILSEKLVNVPALSSSYLVSIQGDPAALHSRNAKRCPSEYGNPHVSKPTL